MRCPSCPAELPDDATHCDECGWDASPTRQLPALVVRTTPHANDADEEEAEAEPEADDQEEPQAEEDSEDSAATEDPPLTLEQKLKLVEQSGIFTIGVIGYATSGKTFFLNRLKHYYKTGNQYRPDPPHHDPDEDGDLRGTVELEVHHFEALHADHGGKQTASQASHGDFWVIDIPGDDFRKAIRAGLQGPVSDELMRVLRLARALIIVLPSEEVFARNPTPAEKSEIALEQHEIDQLRKALANEKMKTPPPGTPEEQRERLAKLELKAAKYNSVLETEAKLDQLLQNVADISLFSRQLTGSDDSVLTAAQFFQLTTKERRARARSSRASAPFTFVAFAKGDQLMGNARGLTRKIQAAFPHIVDRFKLDTAPASLFRIYRPRFHRGIADQFRWHKFDFVTSFEDQPPTDLKPRYLLREHRGVAAVVEWIQWARLYSDRIAATRRIDGKPTLRGRIQNRLVAVENWFVRKMSAWNDAAVALEPHALGMDPAACNASHADAGEDSHQAEQSVTVIALPVLLTLIMLVAAWFYESVSLAVLAPILGIIALLLALAARSIVPRAFPDKRNALLRWRGRMADSLMRPQSVLPRNLLMGGTALLVVVGIAAFLPLFWGGGGNGHFPPKPIYDAELSRMEAGAPVFARGIYAEKLPLWNRIPDRPNGGWFTIAPGNPAYPGVSEAWRNQPNGLGTRSMPGRLDVPIKAFLAAEAAAKASGNGEPRAAINYSLGVLYYWSENWSDARANFQTAFDTVKTLAPGTQQGPAYVTTWPRVLVARVLILQGQGLVELKAGKPEAAMSFFEMALAELGRDKTEIAVGGASAPFFYHATSAEAAPMAELDVADIWTNLLAAMIQNHHKAVASSNREASETWRQQLEQAVTDMRDRHLESEIAKYPELAANLRIAAARSGREGLATSFPLSPTEAGDAGSVAKASAWISGTAPQDEKSTYWRITMSWRQALGDDSESDLSDTFAKDVEDNPKDAADLKDWIGEAVEQRYNEAPPAEQRSLAAKYRPYLSNGLWLRVLERPLILFFMLMLIAWGAWRFRQTMFKRIQTDYRQLHLPRHRDDRLRAGGKAAK